MATQGVLDAVAARGGRRFLLGIAGAPGAGKSTVAEQVAQRARREGIEAAVVAMDGWHLAHSTLLRLGLVDVKGAPHTFDAAGFLVALRRLRDPGGATVWLPQFRREIEDAVAGAIEVRTEHTLVVVEGNYLLLDAAPWGEAAALLDARWLLTPDDELRRRRLIARDVHHGRSAQEARTHALGSDEANAELVRAAAARRTDVELVDPC